MITTNEVKISENNWLDNYKKGICDVSTTDISTLISL